MPIAIAILSHYAASIFFHSFFLHRYAAHRMFSMSKAWERVFYLATYVSMGMSWLEPGAFGVMHLQHHAYSDTRKDPHSPHFFANVVTMMLHTKDRYQAYAERGEQPEPRFQIGYPQWPLLDRIGRTWAARLSWGLVYVLFYVHFATAWWQFLLLPVHFAMGPIHGAIVNWFGHKRGYRNYALNDDSRNTLPVDFLVMGELYQNNHHRFAMSPNFAVRWFEVDFAYQGMRLLNALGIISFGDRVQIPRYPEG